MTMSNLLHWLDWLRWGARLLGVFSLGIYFLSGVGEAFGEPLTGEGVVVLGLLLMSVVAYVTAWRREFWGGASLTLIAMALGGVTFAFAGRDQFIASLVMSLPLFISGGLFAVCGLYDAPSTGNSDLEKR
jgi:hypothetical protein